MPADEPPLPPKLIDTPCELDDVAAEPYELPDLLGGGEPYEEPAEEPDGVDEDVDVADGPTEMTANVRSGG